MVDRRSELRTWQNKLYNLQREAPKPIPVSRTQPLDTGVRQPPQYGLEYHGPLSRMETERLLAMYLDGAFLIRDSQRAEGTYTLAIRFDGSIRNYKLYYEEATRQHYVGEKRFDLVNLLVEDGLIHFYIETRGADVLRKISEANNYEASPFYKTRYHTIQSQTQMLRRAALAASRRGSGGDPSSQTQLPPQQQYPHPATVSPRRWRRQSIDASLPPIPCPAPVSAPVPVPRPTHSLPPPLTDDHSTNNNTIPTPDVGLQSPDTTCPQLPMVVTLAGTQQNNNSGVSGGMQTLTERYNLPVSCLLDMSQLEKAHNFRVHTFRGPHWCDFCTHFMWGLVAQGVKCQDCGFQAHKKCSDRVPHDCLPDMKRLKRVFGIELTSLMKAENKGVPQVLVRCVTEVERRGGLDSEGLYRVPGCHDHVEDIRMAFDKDSETADITEARYSDVNTLTSVIKSFLRQLPIPLITYESYADFIDAVKEDSTDPDKQMELLRRALAKLPPAHFQTLKFFIGHINRVAERQQVNMMTAENLAIVLAPTLMNPPYTDPLACLAASKHEQAAVEHLIVEYHRLFGPALPSLAANSTVT